jgi:hypothetical protein
LRITVPLLATLASLNITGTVLCQSLRYSNALPYVGSCAYSTHQKDILSFTANQAALAKINQAAVGLYGERRFLLASLNSYALAAALPTRLGNFGIQLNYSGFKNFNENKIGVAYAKSLGDKLDVGVQFNYYGYRVPGYSGASAIYAEAGAIVHFTEKLNGGIHIYNPVGGKLGSPATNSGSEEKLASAYKFGVGYDASANFFISSEIIKEEDKPVNVIAGVQYHFAQQFFARAGFSSESSTLFVGAGIGLKYLRLDVGGSYHPQLGFSPGVLLVTNVGRKKVE